MKENKYIHTYNIYNRGIGTLSNIYIMIKQEVINGTMKNEL